MTIPPYPVIISAMYYELPHNITLDETTDIIERHNARLGAKPFIRRETPYGFVFDYVVTFEGVFPPLDDPNYTEREKAIIRECRGLIFDHDGNIMARKYQKFFNLNEREEVLEHNIDWSVGHVVMDKADGSLYSPMLYEGKIRWGSMMGLTDHAAQVDRYVADNPHIEEFVAPLIGEYTPLFEWCSRQNTIVVDYPEDRLILTGIRNNTTGQYTPYHEMAKMAQEYGVDVIHLIEWDGDRKSLINGLGELVDAEGYIIRFDNGMMVKLKGEWYVNLHNARDAMHTEKKAYSIVVNENVDDMVALLDPMMGDKLQRYNRDFMDSAIKWVNRISQAVAHLTSDSPDKKETAKRVSQHGFSALEKSAAFAIINGTDPIEHVMKTLRHYQSSSTRIDVVREIFADVKWEEYYNG